MEANNNRPAFIASGKCSTFGGPLDLGVSPSEGLALIERSDLSDPWFAPLFLREQPPGTTGLARRLDPSALYLAMRWAYTSSAAGRDLRGQGRTLPIVTPRSRLRRNFIELRRKGSRGSWLVAKPVDWGPHEETGRLLDCSPGLLATLGAKTDDELEVRIAWI